MKRLFDLVASLILLVVAGPIQAVIGVLVRLDSRGPAIYKQERIGLDGRTFLILKFRTMQVENEGPLLTVANDSRVTRVGRFLRKWKLDELPQVINVIRGDMSLVGPRPEVAEYVSLWPANARLGILGVRPGITDPASIEFRDESSHLEGTEDPEAYYREIILPRKVELYLDYVRSQSFVGDIKILARTVRSIGQSNGAGS